MLSRVKALGCWLSNPRGLLRVVYDARTLFRNWPILLISNRYIIDKRVFFRLRNGVTFKTVGESDWAPIIGVWSHRIYTPRGFEIAETDTILDVGAHIGAFSIYASKAAPNGCIFAFEPHPESYSVLADNIRMNNACNVTTINAALMASDGETLLYESENVLSHSVLDDKVLKNPREALSVRAMSIQSAIGKFSIGAIDMIKMNCEGAEYEILSSIPDSVYELTRRIVVQYHDVDKSRSGLVLASLLSAKGFSVAFSPPGSYKILFASKSNIDSGYLMDDC